MNSLSLPQFSESDTVICRICDEAVPFDLFEEHTASCVAAHRNENSLSLLNDQIGRKRDEILNSYLRIPWPGDHDEAIQSTLPLLHLVILINCSLELDPNNYEANEEIAQIIKTLQQLNQQTQDIQEILRQKKKFIKALTTNVEVLQQTRLSGSADVGEKMTIAHFEFIKRISSGAYARVFLARKIKTGDIYAIKVIPKSSIKQKNQMRRIFTERDILLSFNNPNIVAFYYSIIGVNNLYLCMEFLPGGDLYSLLQAMGSLEEDFAKLYSLQIVQALRYLHKNHIIHRDLKPDNILISPDGHLKLTDFGLSHIGMVDRHLVDSDLASAPSLVGTPDYVAPEIVQNMPHSYAVDFWSLGCIIYEFLCGVPPFHRDTESETFEAIVRGHFEFPTDFEISSEAKDLISKLLVVDPEKRIGCEEILSHPWFDGVDPENDEPPFLPDSTQETTTQYFEERYTFQSRDDSDIVEDMKAPRRASDSAVLGEIESFPSIAPDTLAAANRRLLSKEQRKRASSFIQDEELQRLAANVAGKSLSKATSCVYRDPDPLLASILKEMSTDYL